MASSTVDSEDSTNYQPIQRSIREQHALVKNVFIIEGFQILITLVAVMPFVVVDIIKTSVKDNFYKIYWIIIIALVVLWCILTLVLLFSRSSRQKFPLNIILLFIATAFMGVVIGILSTLLERSFDLLIGLVFTFILCVSLICFALQTKFDFTSAWPFSFVALVFLLFLPIWFIYFNPTLEIVLASLGTLVIAFYIIVVTQLLLRGRFHFLCSRFDMEDSIAGAIFVYCFGFGLLFYIVRMIRYYFNIC